MVKVISMVSSNHRRAVFAEESRGTALAWGFFDALRQPELPLSYNENLAVSRFGRTLKPGEIGCYASHFAVWGLFLASDAQQLLVLEDDVMVDWPAIEQLCRHDLAGKGIHVLKLFATHPLSTTVAKYKLLSDHSHLLLIHGYAYGTQAYVLTRRGAAALRAACAAMYMPIDWAMSRYWDYRLPNYAIFPFAVLERHGPSTIEHTQSVGGASRRRQRLRRLAWRLKERALRTLFDLAAGPPPAFERPRDVGGPYLDASRPAQPY
jgi:glycosyl transferase family 25